MKKVLFIFLILLNFASLKGKAQVTLETQLRNFPITKYLNKPIDTLIANLPPGYDTSFIIGGNGNINRGASLHISYPPNCFFWVDIYIATPRFINPFKNTQTSSKVAWPLALLKKESVSSVTIYALHSDYEIINEADIY